MSASKVTFHRTEQCSSNKESIDKLVGLLGPSVLPEESFEFRKEVEKELALHTSLSWGVCVCTRVCMPGWLQVVAGSIYPWT